MTAVADRTETVQESVRKGRGRRSVVVLVAVVLAGAVMWALARGPLVYTRGPVLVPGGTTGDPRCDSGVGSREVSDVFGGGGTILRYVDGARCEMMFSITNATSVPVRVLGVETTRGGFIDPLRLIGATRDPLPLSADQECYGCVEDYEPFSPMTIAPGDEWEIAVQGQMRGCQEPDAGDPGAMFQIRESVLFTVEVGGVRRVVDVELANPWAVTHEGCRSRK